MQNLDWGTELIPDWGSHRGDIVIAILAAGKGSRFSGGRPKPLALLEGQTLISHALASAINSGVGSVMVVLGHNDLEIAAELSDPIIIYNPDWQEGIASSLRSAIEAIEPHPCIGAICIGLADQPLIGSEAYRRLADAYFQGANFAVATYRGARRNPVLLGRSIWPEAKKLEGDEGARVLMKTLPVVEIACDDTGNPLDVDTVEDLQTCHTLFSSNN